MKGELNKLSTISLTHPSNFASLKGLSKPKKVTTESHKGNAIIGIICFLIAIVFVLGYLFHLSCHITACICRCKVNTINQQ